MVPLAYSARAGGELSSQQQGCPTGDQSRVVILLLIVLASRYSEVTLRAHRGVFRL